jgi:hypothetical protein
MNVILIVGVIVLSVMLLCTILVIIFKRYDGQIVVRKDLSGKQIFSLELDKTPEEIASMKSVTFNVINEEENPDMPL